MVGDIVSLYRERLAREKGTIRKDWGGKLSVALVYPNHYRLGMSNLGFQTVYGILNRRLDVVAERVFLPEGQEALYYLQKGQPLLSCESQRSLGQFDLVAFSLSFENDYLNVLKILDLGRIPLFSDMRNESFPMVMAGGVTTFLNPEPLAAFIDFFLLGEAEAILDRFVDLFVETRAAVSKRADCLKALARHMESIYVPSLYQIEYGADGTIRSFSPGKRVCRKRSRLPATALTAHLKKISRHRRFRLPTQRFQTWCCLRWAGDAVDPVVSVRPGMHIVLPDSDGGRT